MLMYNYLNTSNVTVNHPQAYGKETVKLFKYI